MSTIIALLVIVLIIFAFVIKPKNESRGEGDKNVAVKVSTSLSAEDVVLKRFQPTKFREGYAQDSVDDLLDRVVVELRRLQEENAGLREFKANPSGPQVSLSTPTITAADVINQKFKPTKFSEGYDQDQVDDYLDEIVNTLRNLNNENEQLRTAIAKNIQ